MRVFDPLNPESYQPGLGHEFPATARSRVMDRAQFIAAESHGIPLGKAIGVRNKLVVIRGGNHVEVIRPATIPARGESMSTLAHVVQQLRKERNQALRSIEQLDKALKALGGLGGVRGRVGRVARAQMPGKKRRTMSAAARKRISAAQRARWAKWKAARRNK